MEASTRWWWTAEPHLQYRLFVCIVLYVRLTAIVIKMSDRLWSLENVHLAGGSRARLQNLSAHIPRGTTAILGLSGAGKTSLLNLLVGFEKPTSGQVRSAPKSADRLQCFWSPPDFGLWPHLTVEQHIKSAGGQPHRWLASFDLESIRHQFPATLSTGEKSRLAIARALAADPAILVLDEPLNHVDPARIGNYWQVIRNTCTENRISLVFSSHDPATVVRESSHLLCLHEGELIWQGQPQDLYERPESERAGWYLGPLNWFEPQEASLWLNRESAAAVPLRPEMLELEAASSGIAVIEQVREFGSLGEAELRHLNGDSTRRVYYRPRGQALQTGLQVCLRACVLLLMLWWGLTMPGCNEAPAGPVFPVSEFVPISFPAEGAKLPAPRGLTFGPEGDLYALDDVGRVLVYDQNAKLIRKWWMPEYKVGRPEGVCVMHDGRLVVADTHYNRCVYFDLAGNVLGMFGTFGQEAGQFIYPIAITQDSAGFLYVAENGGNDRIQKFTANGEFVMQIGKCGVEPGEFQRPSGVVWWEGKLLVADAFNNRILRFADSGEFEQVIADADSVGIHYPYDLAQASDTTLYIVEYGAGRVTHIDLEGKLLGQYGQIGRGDGEFWTPWGLAVRQDGTVFVADTGNRRMVELKP